MARQNKTRDGQVAQKKGVCVLVVPFVEADLVINSAAGSVYASLPARSMIMKVTSNITTASGTANATIDVVANGTVLVNELAAAAANVGDETLVAAARYLATGGELVLLPGATAPADGALIGELVIEYVELDKNSGEYTKFLAS